ncbi:hypothetical protein RI065_04945 [Mycoplasmatota bacterium zrk1]
MAFLLSINNFLEKTIALYEVVAYNGIVTTSYNGVVYREVVIFF